MNAALYLNHQPLTARALPIQGTIKRQAEDFRVTECSPLKPTDLSGQGEHQWLWLEKRQLSTHQVVKYLSQLAQVPQKHIGYAGLKDKRAVTRQWFSVQLPGQPLLPWAELITNLTLNAGENLHCLSTALHDRKLKTGFLNGNRFDLHCRQLSPLPTNTPQPSIAVQAMIEQRLQHIKDHGVPNLFGAQRFGKNGHNLQQFERWIEQGKAPRGKSLQSLTLSAARSYLFNQVLLKKIQLGLWNQPQTGDVWQLHGSRSWFVDNTTDFDVLTQRFVAGDIHPTSPLYGSGPLASQGQVADIEQQVLSAHQPWCDFLIQKGLKMDRLSDRLLVPDLQWQWLNTTDDLDLRLQFTLPAGAFATSVVSELLHWHEGG